MRAIPRCGIYTDNVFSHDGSAKKKGITRTGGKRGRSLPCIRGIPVKKTACRGESATGRLE
ncbi:hypothetical protein CXU22_03890 [Akkermansia muciniphila]|uniref:Uncharacterized protein n=1 Tax=Akkermansia muciniphila TaxID=239935 RepID=A0A2N8HF86_9BACT|nr:hypothetical protein CXU22_03890 [Akkermansia muciniphila]